MSSMTASERLQKLIETEQMTAKQFSKEVGIQPGTVSNILKGRNNPSLEVMQKVLNRFRSVSSDWLILGVGSMYRQKNDSQQATLFDIPPTESADDNINNKEQEVPVVLTQPSKYVAMAQAQPPKRVSRVMIIYDDGTFEEICG